MDDYSCSHLGATLEVLSGLSQVGVTHQVLSVLELAALLQETFGICLGCQVGVRVLVYGAHHLVLGHVVPVDLELGDARLFCQNVTSQSFDHGLSGRVLVHFWRVILNIDVVADAQELL